MIDYDVAIKVLDTEIFPQHTIDDLSLFHYICCFIQLGEDSIVEVNKHTHIHTHTHTHTHTHLVGK